MKSEFRTEGGYMTHEINKLFSELKEALDNGHGLEMFTMKLAKQGAHLNLVEYFKVAEQSYIIMVEAGYMDALEANQQLDKELVEIERLYSEVK